MNRGQELSLSYILERVKEDEVEEEKALFVQVFKKKWKVISHKMILHSLFLK